MPITMNLWTHYDDNRNTNLFSDRLLAQYYQGGLRVSKTS